MSVMTIDQTLRVNDYYAKVIKVGADDHPIQTLLKRGKKPREWEEKVELEGRTKSYSLAAPEGGDFDESKLKVRTNVKLTCQLQKFRTQNGYFVTRETSLLPGYTQEMGEKELARQQRKDAEELILSMERAFGSAQEAVERGTGRDTVPMTRGMLSWLKKGGAHDVQPIPNIVKPGCGIEGDITNLSVFSEEIFKKELLKAAKEQGDGNLSVVLLAGIDLKVLMSSWLGRATTVDNFTNILRRNETKGRSIELICDEFTWDGVKCRSLVDNHLGCTIGNSGTEVVQTAKGFMTGAVIRPEFWSLDFLEDMAAFDLEDKGGGPRGYHEAIVRLACHNPTSQFAILHTVDDESSSSSSSS